MANDVEIMPWQNWEREARFTFSHHPDFYVQLAIMWMANIPIVMISLCQLSSVNSDC